MSFLKPVVCKNDRNLTFPIFNFVLISRDYIIISGTCPSWTRTYVFTDDSYFGGPGRAAMENISYQDASRFSSQISPLSYGLGGIRRACKKFAVRGRRKSRQVSAHSFTSASNRFRSFAILC